MVPAEADEREPIRLSRRQRALLIGLGSLFIAVPLLVHIDARIGLLGPDIEPGGIDLTLAVFTVIGALLLISGIVGVLFTWQGVSPAHGAADRKRTEASPPKTITGVQRADGSAPPPFNGTFTESTLDDADPDFVDAARDFYDTQLRGSKPFATSVTQVYRSAAGRPSWYFEVENTSGQRQWIRVPHRGKAGRGAGAALS